MREKSVPDRQARPDLRQRFLPDARNLQQVVDGLIGPAGDDCGRIDLANARELLELPGRGDVQGEGFVARGSFCGEKLAFARLDFEAKIDKRRPRRVRGDGAPWSYAESTW